MAGPYTAFTFGDPKISPATISRVNVSAVGFTLTGNPYPVPLDVELPHGVVGSTYSTTITAAGGASPYTFALTSGVLPSGLSISSGGVISGTPTTTGLPSFTITATDSNGVTGATVFTLTVSNAVAGNYGFVN